MLFVTLPVVVPRQYRQDQDEDQYSGLADIIIIKDICRAQN